MKRSRFSERTDHWDIAGGGGRESDKDGLCGAYILAMAIGALRR